MLKPSIIVVGAGAAGLMAAGRAAELGARVVLLEHKNKPGRKLAITGKGRCNLTNSATLPEFLKHFHPDGRFLRQAFSLFFAGDTMDFFKYHNVPVIVERGGRVFPASGKAPDVVKAMLRWNDSVGVELCGNTTVDSLIVESGEIKKVCVYRTSDHNGRVVKDKSSSLSLKADMVILATGGISYPATGSTGDGYRLAESVGHSIIPARPALVPLETACQRTKRLNNLVLKNVAVKTWIDGKKRNEAFGEMVFTDFGLSGPIVLSLSNEIVNALIDGKRCSITIDLKPALDHKKLDSRLIRDFKRDNKKQFQSILKKLLPGKMIDFCLDESGIPPHKTGNCISADERKKLRLWLKELRFEISGYRPFSEAIITAGGVNLREVNPKTMKSRKINNLYFAGEMLDIQADTGGYNLQSAFSTGRLAAESSIKSWHQQR